MKWSSEKAERRITLILVIVLLLLQPFIFHRWHYLSVIVTQLETALDRLEKEQILLRTYSDAPRTLK